MDEWLCLAYADMVDGPDGWVNRFELRETVDAQLARPWADVLAESRARLAKQAATGRDPRTGQGGRGMLDPGAPAPMRPPDAQRPAAWKAREEAPPP